MNLGYIGDSLPKLWCAPRLADLATPKQWKTIPKKNLLKEGFTVYGANGEIGFFNEYTHESPTIMITCRGATCGNLHISRPYSYINGNAMALDHQPTELVGLKFLYYALKARGLEDTISGSAQPQITGKGLEIVRIPLPSVAEQKVIADKLDTLLAEVETTKARIERIPKILKRFRQSILAAATSGRLTEALRASSVHYDHPLSQNWKWPPVPEGWDVKFYSELVDSRLGKMLDKAKNSGTATKYLGNVNVRWFNFNLSDIQEILVSESEVNELSIKPGDLLICEGGEPGRCAIWDGRISGKIVFQKALHRARVSGCMVPEWLSLNLKHDADSLTLDQLITGTTIRHLTGKALKKYPLRIPPIKEQTEIVRQVDQFFNYAERIEKQVNNALAQINNLTQSILAKAFRGELTEQWRKDNPDLIFGENSAEALLQRIKAEREQLSAQKPKRQKRSKQ